MDAEEEEEEFMAGLAAGLAASRGRVVVGMAGLGLLAVPSLGFGALAWLRRVWFGDRSSFLLAAGHSVITLLYPVHPPASSASPTYLSTADLIGQMSLRTPLNALNRRNTLRRANRNPKIFHNLHFCQDTIRALQLSSTPSEAIYPRREGGEQVSRAKSLVCLFVCALRKSFRSLLTHTTTQEADQ